MLATPRCLVRIVANIYRITGLALQLAPSASLLPNKEAGLLLDHDQVVDRCNCCFV